MHTKLWCGNQKTREPSGNLYVYFLIIYLFIYFTYLLTLFNDAVSVPILNFSIGLEGMLVQAAVL
jgi:hypothetical protein